MDHRPKTGMPILQGLGVALMLVGLPLLGIVATGRDFGPYLEFPPATRYVRHAGFAWFWFIGFTAADLSLVGGLVWVLRQAHKNRPAAVKPTSVSTGNFPWWGVAGLLLCLIAWLMAWQRFSWFWLFQPHTFLPLWAGFILFLNALALRRSGSCLLLRQPLRFLLLFPISTAFWWFFEYLNRFVQSWYYTGVADMGSGEYAYYASLSFATVLPGVLSMIDLLLTFPVLGKSLACCRPVPFSFSRRLSRTVLLTAGIGLFLIGIFPDQLFSLIWVAPLLALLSVQGLGGRRTLLQPLTVGDWRPLVVPAIAALICGFFWELWNVFSLARWSYTLPYVQRYHLFAMPILGYGGYLTFGLECLLAGTWVMGDLFGLDRRRGDEASIPGESRPHTCQEW